MRALALLAIAACGRQNFDARLDAAVDAQADAVVLPNPIAWWKLDEGTGTTAADSAGSANGTFTGPVQWQAVTGGPVATAVAFPGSPLAYVDLGGAPQLANLPQLTIVAWILPQPAVVEGNAHCFFDKGDVSPTLTGGWAFSYTLDAVGDLAFEAFFSGSGANLIYVHRSTVAGAVPAGTWARVAATWDGSALASGVHVYVNGSEADYNVAIDATGATRPDDSGIGAGIGCIANTQMAGMEADVRIYDQVLTPAQIAAL